MKVLDFSHGCSNLWLFELVGVPENSDRFHGPHHSRLEPVNDSSQFDFRAVGRFTVSFAGLRISGQKLTARKFADSQGWRNPRNGWHDATLYADAEVNEKNKPYLAIRRRTVPSLVLQRMAVCL